jgi:chromosome segregation ATPase
MTNEKNNINELVSDDEDPTAELEAVTFQQDRLPADSLSSESDENTYDVENRVSDDAKTIGKLQYDIEHLRAKWLGLEAEIKAREELTDKLTVELEGLRESVSRKTKLLKLRDSKVKALKTEIRERDKHHRKISAELTGELDQARKAARAMPQPPDSSASTSDTEDRHERLARAESYADSLRRKFQDILASHENLESDRDRLQNALTDAMAKNRRLSDDLADTNQANLALEEKLSAMTDKHAEDMRILRFELGEAQETMAQTEVLNTQLASDLVDTRGFKEELERMLCDSDEQSQARIEQLETELLQATRRAHDLEEKLEARSDAINVLLAELARKSEQVESIGEIGDVISDIDDRISERFDEEDDPGGSTQKSYDRVTRVLIGKIGDQLLRFPLFKDRLTIGRTSDNDIQLNAGYISRRHAVVQTDGETTRVIDWGSKNGVYVNSKQVTEHFLKNGDIVTIGNAHFRYEERPKRDA